MKQLYKKIFLPLLVLSALLASNKAFGIEEEEVIKLDTEGGALTSTIFKFADFEGKRSALEDKGINIQSSYIIDAFALSNREKKSKKGTYQGLYNLSLELDTEKMNLYKGGKLYALYQAGNKGMNSNDFMNTFSDNNSFDPMQSINQLSELYYEQSFKDDLLNIKFGKQDANMDFQALDTGFEFLNLSFSFIPNTPMPLFPCQQTGARVRVKTKGDFYIQDGIYAGNMDVASTPKGFFTGKNNYFNILEGYKLTNIKGKAGKYAAGGWIKTGKYEHLEKGSLKRNNYGFYAEFEQKLTDKFEDKSGGVSMFGQFGYAKGGINEVPYYGSLGFVYKGPFKKRKQDSVGIAFAWHQFDKAMRHLEHKTAEKVVEIFYKIKITNYLSIQPDIQYIIRPNGTDKNGLALGIRTVINF